jgi:hypothetical protein
MGILPSALRSLDRIEKRSRAARRSLVRNADLGSFSLHPDGWQVPALVSARVGGGGSGSAKAARPLAHELTRRGPQGQADELRVVLTQTSRMCRCSIPPWPTCGAGARLLQAIVQCGPAQIRASLVPPTLGHAPFGCRPAPGLMSTPLIALKANKDTICFPAGVEQAEISSSICWLSSATIGASGP